MLPLGSVVTWNSYALEFASELEYVLIPSVNEKLVKFGKIFALAKLDGNGVAVVKCPLSFWPAA
jgi:hypothetical protein